MHAKRILEKIARLEFVNDQLTSELGYVDQLLKSVGFAEGLISLKSAAQELFEQQGDDSCNEGQKG